MLGLAKGEGGLIERVSDGGRGGNGFGAERKIEDRTGPLDEESALLIFEGGGDDGPICEGEAAGERKEAGLKRAVFDVEGAAGGDGDAEGFFGAGFAREASVDVDDACDVGVNDEHGLHKKPLPCLRKFDYAYDICKGGEEYDVRGGRTQT